VVFVVWTPGQTTATGLPKALTQAITEEEMKAGGAKLHGKMVRGVSCHGVPWIRAHLLTYCT